MQIDISDYDNVASLEWEDGTTVPFYEVNESGSYVVAITQPGTCVVLDTIEVTLRDCVAECRIQAPTAFTPNGDGLNDAFSIITDCPDGFSFFELRVFNRWGEQVFETVDHTRAWDGTYRGQVVPLGTYVFSVRYSKEGADEVDQFAGSITVIR